MNKSNWINNNNDMINLFYNNILNFISINNEYIKLNTDEESYFNKFCDFLFDNYILNKELDKINMDNNFDYFETMFCSDLTDLFIEIKNIAQGYTSDIFKKKYNSYDLIEFIYKNITLYENYNEIIDVSDEYEEDYF